MGYIVTIACVLIKRRRKYDILWAVWRGVALSYSDQSLSLYFSADQVKDNSSLASLLDNVSVKLETGGDCAHLNGELPNLDWTDLQGDSQSLENRDTKFIVH